MDRFAESSIQRGTFKLRCTTDYSARQGPVDPNFMQHNSMFVERRMSTFEINN